MTKSPATSRLFAVLAAGLAFVATLAVLLLGGSTDERGAAELSASPRGASTAARIERFTAAVRANPRDVDSYTLLAAAHLQNVRETGDPEGYQRADVALTKALALRPGDAGALTERGALRMARHDFSGALADARAARAAAPDVNKPFGVLVDALVELGRYGAAGRALQEMVDRRPNLDAYARVSYYRELHGDLDGAAEALRLAIAAGGSGPENTSFVQALLGDLELVRGRPEAAERAYRKALAFVPDHAPSQFGLVRADAARGRLAAAMRRLRPLVADSGEPVYTTYLGELELVTGRRAQARRRFALARRQLDLHASRGENIAAELAVFQADHGSPAAAVRNGRRGWRHAPSVTAADARGWALTQAGRPEEGLRWARRALRLGSRDPSFVFHAAVAAARSGRRAEAQRLLRLAPARSLSPRHARAMAQIL